MAEVAKKQPELTSLPDAGGHFGVFGGRFVAETLMAALDELEQAWRRHWSDGDFVARFGSDLAHFVGRPSPLYVAENLTRKGGGAKIVLKREDLNHTGAHKLNNTVGQALLAQAMRNQRVIADTRAGQHGAATATVPARLRTPRGGD